MLRVKVSVSTSVEADTPRGAKKFLEQYDTVAVDLVKKRRIFTECHPFLFEKDQSPQARTWGNLPQLWRCLSRSAPKYVLTTMHARRLDARKASRMEKQAKQLGRGK